MKVAEAIAHASSRLASESIDEARIEAEVLLMHALELSREQLYTRLKDVLAPPDAERYEALVARRVAHEPTAYITGHKEFFGLNFRCSPAALIPRPETELLVGTAIDFVAGSGSQTADLAAVDVGTGCGAVAIAIAHEAPGLRLAATDVSLDALTLAHRNACIHGVDQQVDFVAGSLLEPLQGTFDLILANLPYVASRTYSALSPEIQDYEPAAALRAGRRGTAAIEELLAEAAGRLRPGGLLLAEHGWNQGARLRRAAADYFPTAAIDTRRDLARLDRLLVVRAGVYL